MNERAGRVARGRRLGPSVEGLESRTLLSAAWPQLLSRVNLPPALVRGIGDRLAAQVKLPAGLPGGIKIPGLKTDPAAVAIIRDALLGRGPAAEFGALIRGQLGNATKLIADFASGKTKEYVGPGIVVRLPQVQEHFTGRHFDHVKATAAGVVLQRDGVLQMGVVVQGPFDEAESSQVIFGIDRGSGSKMGPLYSQRPQIKPDALVEVTIGPKGKTWSGQIRDLTDGKVTKLDPAKIRVVGATVRVFVDSKLLPTKGKAVKSYRFAAWTRQGTTGGIETIGNFAPDKSMAPIGVSRR